MDNTRQALVHLFAELEFAPFGLSGWTGDVGVDDWDTDEDGRVESITLAYGRGDRALVRVTTARRDTDLDELLDVEGAGSFQLGLNVSGRVARFSAIGDGGAWVALRESDGRGPHVAVSARDVKPTSVKLERVAESKPFIDGPPPG